jgi:hypothetical protein
VVFRRQSHLFGRAFGIPVRMMKTHLCHRPLHRH